MRVHHRVIVLLLAVLALVIHPTTPIAAQDPDGSEEPEPLPDLPRIAEPTEADASPEAPLTLAVSAPGVIVSGTMTADDERDVVRFTVAKEMVVNFHVPSSHALVLRCRALDLSAYSKSGRTPEFRWLTVQLRPDVTYDFQIDRYRVPADETTTWSLVIEHAGAGPFADIEPNDRSAAAEAIVIPAAGLEWAGRASSIKDSEADYYRFDVDRRAIYRIEIRCGEIKSRTHCSADFYTPDRRWVFEYDFDDQLPSYVFFPVLDAGRWDLRITLRSMEVGTGYHVSIRPFVPTVDDELLSAARAAVDKGVAFLTATPLADVGRINHKEAAESLVAAALATGEGASDRTAAVAAYLEWMAGEFEEHSKGSWRGEPVFAPDYETYENAIVALSLAEIAEGGPEAVRETARGLCHKLVRWLLAAQQSEVKADGWGGPTKRGEDPFGGWRYKGDSKDADISVQGWVLIALLAADAAGVREAGMRDAVANGMAYVKRCAGSRGYTYEVGRGNPSTIRNSIGALLQTLWAEEQPVNGPMDTALALLDDHLPAGTQVDDGDNWFLYYAYYCTRLHYLRGGYPWLAWRSTMMRQLIRLQSDDGSWAGTAKERGAVETRFITALSVLILRICLEDVPAYLRHEVRGF